MGWIINLMREYKAVKHTVIGGVILFATYIILILCGCPLFFDYFEYPRYSGWCWGPKNGKGEWTVVYGKITEKVRHLKGAGIFGYKVMGKYVQIAQVNIDGSDNRVLSEIDAKVGGGVCDYSQKTGKVLFVTQATNPAAPGGRDLCLMNLDGSNKELLLNGSCTNAQFSPDGTKIALVACDMSERETSYLWLMDIKSRKVKCLCDVGKDGYDYWTWHPSGKYLITAMNKKAGWIIDLDGKIIDKIDTKASTPCFSPDGNYLVGYCNMFRIKRTMSEGKEKWTGEDTPGIHFGGGGNAPKWSPCGRYIIAGSEGGVTIVDLLYGYDGKVLTPGLSRGEFDREQSRITLRGFRQWVQQNDPEWWNVMIQKFPRR